MAKARLNSKQLLEISTDGGKFGSSKASATDMPFKGLCQWSPSKQKKQQQQQQQQQQAETTCRQLIPIVVEPAGPCVQAASVDDLQSEGLSVTPGSAEQPSQCLDETSRLDLSNPYSSSKHRSNSYDVACLEESASPSSPEATKGGDGRCSCSHGGGGDSGGGSGVRSGSGILNRLALPTGLGRKRGRSLELPKVCVHCAYLEDAAKASGGSRTSSDSLFLSSDDAAEDSRRGRGAATAAVPTASGNFLQVPGAFGSAPVGCRTGSLDEASWRRPAADAVSSSCCVVRQRQTGSAEADSAGSAKQRASSIDVATCDRHRARNAEPGSRANSGATSGPAQNSQVCFLHPGYQQSDDKHGQQQQQQQPKSWKTSVDWSDSAVNGEHIWIDTSASGDFCYVGESDCCKTGSKKKCTTCKIIIHAGCFEQLEKIAFRCKPTFREGGIKGYRQGELFTKHHWVHRRRQEGKCKACGKSFQQKFPFNNKEVTAIACSWCKAAYHNKINCFMMHLIDESCNFGPHASIILPPSWVTKTPPKSRNRSSTRRRGSHKNSFKRRKSKTNLQASSGGGGGGGGGGGCGGAQANSQPSPQPSSPSAQSPFVIKPVASQPHVRPVLVFINPRSGGNQGAKLMQKFLWLLNPRQVFDLTQHEPAFALDLFRRVPGLRILVCGGDGTAGWVLSTIDRLGICPSPPVAILPLGTGNDLARTLNWGPGYTDEPLSKILCCVEEGRVVLLDRWRVDIEPNPDCPAEAPIPEPSGEATNSGGGGRSTTDKPHVSVFNNYFSLGADAAVALEFHESREANPERFNSRLRNIMFYAGEGSRSIIRRPWRELSQVVLLECDGVNLTDRIRELRVTSILFLNIPKYSAGATPWGNPTGSQGFEPQRPDDGYVEVIGFSSSHLATVQMGWHGHRICQCKRAVIRTSRVIPIQIDGEPWRLQPSVIDIRLHNQASMIQKPKRRNSIPLIADMSIDSDYGFNPASSGQPLIMERLRMQVSVVAISDYESMLYDKDRLRLASYPLGLILVEVDSDLDNVRSHIDRLAADASIITKNGSYRLSPGWVYLDSTTAERFFRIDKSQEALHYITDISSEDLYLLDPELIVRSSCGDSSGASGITDTQLDTVVEVAATAEAAEISPTEDSGPPRELGSADYRCSSSEPGSPELQSSVETPGPIAASVAAATQTAAAAAAAAELNKALIDACKRGCLDKMRCLREEGADLGTTDSAGMTCLHHATRFGYRDIVAYLIEYGPPQLLDQTDLEKGQTALHKASWYQRRQICQLLVQAGASLTTADFSGLTPRQQAFKAEDKELAQWLESQEHIQLVRKENQETEV